ncbi:MAG: Ig-like domain-containing protein [Planctomycetota bacterium]
MTGRSLAALAGLGLALLAPGCDNPACVFGPGACSGGGVIGVGENPATLPRNGDWIEAASPSIAGTFPVSTVAASVTTPIVLLFTETMVPLNFGTATPSGLGSAFELQSAVGPQVPLPVASLVGDGRVLVLLPPTDLRPDTTYDIVLRDTAVLSDLSGQSLAVPANRLLGSFTTAALETDTPRVVFAWPRGASVNQSATTEIVVVFDREINPATVDDTSFEVLVNDLPPTFDPVPTALGFGGPLSDSRVFLWRSVDGSGAPVPLGQGASVEVNLSGAGNEIEDTEGGVLPLTSFEFTTAAFSPPTSSAITSDPSDAIGIDQISGPANLALEVEFSGAVAGDRVVLTMFGTSPSIPLNPPLIALRREVPLVAPFDSFTLTAGEIDLLLSPNPVRGRFLDGPVTIAVQLRHGNATSPVQVLDVDPGEPGVQSPILDTVPPTVTGLSTSGTEVAFLRSDVRDLVLVGRASEDLSRALVTTALGDNRLTPGEAPPVADEPGPGIFVAAPVRVGLIPAASLPVDYELTIFDRALNSATVRSDVLDPDDGFTQLGQSGPGTALPGGTVTVHVYDSTTLLPIPAANVHVVENLGGTVGMVVGGVALTAADGSATISAAPVGETILTVERTGYDLFTFDGVPTERLGIPLTPSLIGVAEAAGTIGPQDQNAVIQLNLYTRAVSDSRRREAGLVFPTVSPCVLDATDGRFECPFGPIFVRPRRIGVQSAITVLEPPDLFLYSALTFLKTAEIFAPAPPIEAGATQQTHLPLGPLLDAGTLDPEERPVDAPPQLLSTAAWPSLANPPSVAVEATAPGIPAAVTVGRGVAFDDAMPADTWTLRAAYPGSVDGIQDVPADELGRLVAAGRVEADLMLRVDVGDPAGNRGGARPRFSLATGAITLPPIPLLPVNPATPNAGGISFDLTFPDVLPDSLSPPGKGIYRIELTDSASRRWTIFRPDPTDAQGPDVVVHVPDLAGLFPLAAGDLSARISAWSWPTLDLSGFLWTDIEREHDLFLHSIGQSFTPP